MTETPPSATPSPTSRSQIPWTKTLLALGVVYGDIGTSPLYAFKECFGHAHSLAINTQNVLGVLSLIVWSLILIISVKYLVIVVRADNRGEGGVLALMSLAFPARSPERKKRQYLVYMGIIGAALLYGDGVITPAISVLSAIEGIKVIAPVFSGYIVPITIIVLFFIFYMQSIGTHRIGAIFGPIILLWYSTIGTLGVIQILDTPWILTALNPLYAIEFFIANGTHGFLTLGGVFLVVTGGEALYADMGHFGKNPIRLGWFFVALPGLLLNYFGQGALLLSNPETISNPFYLLAPQWLTPALVCLATAATIIASQAVISGAFSLTHQAIKLGYLPRMEIRHTSAKDIGQIYVAPINWALLIVTIWLVVEFQNSGALAAAYGIAVSATMVITAILMTFVAQRYWQWGYLKIGVYLIPLLIADLFFFAANAIKIPDGGWVPIILGLIIFILMTTWRKGREILSHRMAENLMPLASFIKSFRGYPRTAGTAIFMTRNTKLTPPALLHNVRHNKVLHERIILMVVEFEEVPHIPPAERVKIELMESGFYHLVAHFGYRDEPNIPALLKLVDLDHKHLRASEAIFFLGRETILATARPGMAIWRENLFAFMSRNSQSATRFFKLPCERVVEIGLQVEI